MKVWSVLFLVVGSFQIVLSFFSLVGSSPSFFSFFTFLIASLPFFFLSKLCRVITDMRAAQDECLANQKRLLIMVDNLKED